jgi:phosphonopyruvate decarboxylase
MTSLEACRVVSDRRMDGIVVCTMGAMNAMDQLPLHPLTVACVPLMGGAASLGLGLAVACPDKKVFVLDGDASLLMELGGLVSVAQAAPANYFHFLLNNSVQFAGLGNLPTPGEGRTDFSALAKAAGYAATYRFETLSSFEAGIAEVLQGASPAFVELRVSSETPTLGTQRSSVEMTDARFTRMGDELRRIRNILAPETGDTIGLKQAAISDRPASLMPSS